MAAMDSMQWTVGDARTRPFHQPVGRYRPECEFLYTMTDFNVLPNEALVLVKATAVNGYTKIIVALVKSGHRVATRVPFAGRQ